MNKEIFNLSKKCKGSVIVVNVPVEPSDGDRSKQQECTQSGNKIFY